MILDFNEQNKTVTVPVDFFLTHFDVKLTDLAQPTFAQDKPITVHKATSKPEELEQIISNLLKSLGVPPHIKGYRCLRNAIQLVTYYPETLNNMIKEVYGTVASMTHDTPSRVERAMRHAIEVSWDKNSELQSEIFGTVVDDYKRPVVSLYLATIAEYIRMKHNL